MPVKMNSRRSVSGYVCKACAQAGRERGERTREMPGIGGDRVLQVDLLISAKASRSLVYGYESNLLVYIILNEKRVETLPIGEGIDKCCCKLHRCLVFV